MLQRAIDMTRVIRTSNNPPWNELRERLQVLGVSVTDAVLADWVTEGDVNMGATIATRDGRVFDVMVVMGYNADRTRVANDQGFVSSFREVDPDKITRTADGAPNSWLQAVMLARLVLAEEE